VNGIKFTATPFSFIVFHAEVDPPKNCQFDAELLENCSSFAFYGTITCQFIKFMQFETTCATDQCDSTFRNHGEIIYSRFSSFQEEPDLPLCGHLNEDFE
jgi:hypothetical protein